MKTKFKTYTESNFNQKINRDLEAIKPELYVLIRKKASRLMKSKYAHYQKGTEEYKNGIRMLMLRLYYSLNGVNLQVVIR